MIRIRLRNVYMSTLCTHTYMWFNVLQFLDAISHNVLPKNTNLLHIFKGFVLYLKVMYRIRIFIQIRNLFYVKSQTDWSFLKLILYYTIL